MRKRARFFVSAVRNRGIIITKKSFDEAVRSDEIVVAKASETGLAASSGQLGAIRGVESGFRVNLVGHPATMAR